MDRSSCAEALKDKLKAIYNFFFFLRSQLRCVFANRVRENVLLPYVFDYLLKLTPGSIIWLLGSLMRTELASTPPEV